MALIYTLLFLNVFYAMYVLVMGIYRAHLSGRLRWYHYTLLWWAILLGLAMDVFANCTIACIVFWDTPKEWLVTARMQRYRVAGTPYQQGISAFICDNLLDPFDPTEEHC